MGRYVEWRYSNVSQRKELRHTLVRLRDRNEIDDSVLQQVQAVFDLERVAVARVR